MNILLIGPKWMGGWLEGVERPLRQFGHTVIPFYYDTPTAPTIARNKIKISSYIPSLFHPLFLPIADNIGMAWEKDMNEKLISIARTFKADLAFILKGETLYAETLSEIKSLSSQVISWWVDDPILYFHNHPQLRSQLEIIDMLFIFDRGRLQELKQLDVKQIEYLPCAFDPAVYYPKQVSLADIKKYQSDVGMISSYYSKRGELLNYMHGFNVAVWGIGWKNKPEIKAFPSGTLRGKTLDGHQIATAYNIMKICPNVHHSQTVLGGLNMRAFEIPAARGFQLMNEVQGAEELFEPNTELVMYQSPEHFRQLAEYYLKHEDERKAIAKRGYERAVCDHTYEQRLKKSISGFGFMIRALITGSSGFVGSHLTRSLLAKNWQVAGFDIAPANNLENFYQGELSDKNAITHALQDFKPDVIFHLAGLIKSNEPHDLYTVNLQTTVTLLDCVLECNIKPQIILASSSAVYGLTSGEKKITEKSQIRPATHYAVSKAAQELVALRYFDAGLLPVKIIRMFNLLGPGQSPALACSSFARQIALAEKHGKDEIFTGNLDALRDFVDVRDAVRAFETIIEHGETGEIYNVCSGKAVSLKECLGEMMAQSQKQLSARVDAEKIQTNDIPIQVGSYLKIKKACGWSPKISLKESLTDLLNDWRERVQLNAE